MCPGVHAKGVWFNDLDLLLTFGVKENWPSGEVVEAYPERVPLGLTDTDQNTPRVLMSLSSSF